MGFGLLGLWISDIYIYIYIHFFFLAVGCGYHIEVVASGVVVEVDVAG